MRSGYSKATGEKNIELLSGPPSLARPRLQRLLAPNGSRWAAQRADPLGHCPSYKAGRQRDFAPSHVTSLDPPLTVRVGVLHYPATGAIQRTKRVLFARKLSCRVGLDPCGGLH